MTTRDLPAFFGALSVGQIQTIVGADPLTIRNAMEIADEPTRSALVLVIDISSAATTIQIISKILDDLAELALATWPRWTEIKNSVLKISNNPSWRKAATKMAAAGRPPRFPKVAIEIQLAQLLSTLDPAGLVLVAPLDAVRAPACAIAALEWAARHGAIVVALFKTLPRRGSDCDRLIYEAVTVEYPDEKDTNPELNNAVSRLITPSGGVHPASMIETRVMAAILADTELAPLFTSNVVLRTNPLGRNPRVDLLWAAGQVVVEIDGPEHGVEPKFSDDRHRDFELIISGYVVLRISNAQVAVDLQRAIEKIRAIVRLRKSERKIP